MERQKRTGKTADPGPEVVLRPIVARRMAQTRPQREHRLAYLLILLRSHSPVIAGARWYARNIDADAPVRSPAAETAAIGGDPRRIKCPRKMSGLFLRCRVLPAAAIEPHAGFCSDATRSQAGNAQDGAPH